MPKASKHEAIICSRLEALEQEIQRRDNELTVLRSDRRLLKDLLAQAEEEGRGSAERSK